MSRISIVGAGIGGLSTGIRLLHKGHEVTIYEKNSYPGGCIHYTTSHDGRFKIEESASLPINFLTYEEIFKAVGKNPKEYFKWIPLENYYKVFTYTHREFNLNTNLIKTQENLRRYYPEDIEGYTEFIYKTSQKYLKAKGNLLNKPFIYREKIYTIKTFKTLQQLHTLTPASSYVKGFVKAKELRQLILFQTFFMGISPYKIPNIYTAIAANTQIEGMAHIEGGLTAYVSALEKLYLELGGRIHYNCKIEKVVHTSREVKGLLYKGKLIPSDKIVLNVDYINSQKVLLERKVKDSFNLSCSTFVIHLGLSKTFQHLEVHNLYLNKKFKEEIERVFKGKFPETPSLYIYYPSSIDKSFCKNPLHSVMNIMVRVPNLESLDIPWGEKSKEKLYKKCIKIISSIQQLKDIEKFIIYHECTTPRDFETQYGYYKGSCFGLGHTFFQSMVFRPQVKDIQVEGLYYVGTSIHPGNGASIVMDCAKLTAEEIEKENFKERGLKEDGIS